jgi:hypothetical protein
MQARGLVAWYPMVSPGTLLGRDLAGYGNDGTLTGFDPAADWRVDAEFGSVLSLDATDAYITIPTVNAVPIGTADRAVAFWMYQRTRTNGVNSAIFSLGDSGTSKKWIVQLATVGGTTYIFTDAVAVAQTITGAQIPSLNAWHHIVFSTYNGGANWAYHLNGIRIGAGSFTAVSVVATDMAIGRRSIGATGYFDGLIADLRVYNRHFYENEEPFQMWAPQTRWELYRPIRRRATTIPFAPPFGNPRFRDLLSPATGY